MTYYELLRMFSNNIDKENAVLFVFGFSFADEHIREIVNRAVKSNPTLLVVIFAFNEEAESQIKKNLKMESSEIRNIVFVQRIKEELNKEEDKKEKEFKEKEFKEKDFDLAIINKEFFKKIANSLVKSKDSRPVVNVVFQDKKEEEKGEK